VVSWVARPAAMNAGSAPDEFVEQPKTIAKPAPSKPAPSQSDDEMFS